MFFRNPTYFWLIVAALAVEVVLVVALRRRREQLRAFAEASLVPRLAPDVDNRRRSIRIALRLATLGLLIVALAGPKWGFEWEQVKRQGIDLIVAIDTSRSMLATDVRPNRLERAKLAVLDLVKLMEGDRLGLVPFAGTAFLECPLTLDRAAFERSLHAIDVGIIPRGGTALSRAIDTSLEGFEARQGKYEALILITDGEDNEGDAEEAAKRAADRGVKIYTIGIGTPEGELIPSGEQAAQGFVKDRKGQVVKSRLNEDILQKIALASGGAYVRGSGASLGLDEIFNEHIAKMERREVASTLERRYEERFQIPLAAALVFLLIELLTGERRLSRRRRWWARRADAVRAGTTALMILLMPLLVGWFDPPGDRAAEGNRLYDQGKYNEAADKYGEGLVDAPESPLLQFNRGAALYKQGKYAEAITALTKIAASPDNKWAAPAAFNLGNAQAQLAGNAEQSDPQAAIASYEQALASYKRSMGADPGDDAAKFNHELVEHKVVALKKRLEEERKKKEEEQQKQQEQQQEQQPPPDEQQGEQDQQQEQEQEQGQQQPQEQNQTPQEQPEEQPQPQQDQAGEQQQEEQQPQQQQEQAGQQEQPQEQQQQEQQAAQGGQGAPMAGEEGEPDPEKQAAQAVMDVARDEELGPEDINRPVVGAGVAEPAQDW